MARNPSGMGALSLTTVFGLDGMDNFPTTTQISDPGPSFKSSEEFVGDFPFGISTARNRVTLTVDVRLQTMGADPDLASLLLQGVRITGFLNDRGF